MNKELLSPVGSIEAFYAAINMGANAIYLAGEAYGARKAVSHFTNEEIREMIKIAHRYNVLVYVTMNTIIFDDEMEEAIKYADFLYESGVDAILVCDLGLINIFTKRYKDLAIHISTQANIKTLEEVKFYESLSPNITRVVLAREVSIDEIKRIKKNSHLEIEVFIHGALCMGYSGECLFSSLIFKRSGNRGECAQPCRLKYSLYRDSEKVSKEEYLISTKELNVSEHIKELIDIGVDSFKIEGRIKSGEYVSYITHIYRELIDNPNRKLEDIEKESMRLLYNRDFTKGYIFNEENTNISNTYRPNHLGIEAGEIISNNLEIKLSHKLHRLDGIRILDKEDFGITVDKIIKGTKEVEEAYPNDTVKIITRNSYKTKMGSKVLLTSSYELSQNLKPTMDKIKKKCRPLNIKFLAKLGDKPKLICDDLIIQNDFVIQESLTRPINEKDIENQLSKLNDTPYYLNQFKYEGDKNIYIPLGVINALRRDLVNSLDEKLEHNNRTINYDYTFEKTNVKYIQSTSIQVSSVNEIGIVKGLGFDNIYLNNFMIEDNHNLLVQDRISSGNEKYEVISTFENIKDKIISPYRNVTNIYGAQLLFSMGAKKIILSYEISRSNLLSFVSRYENTFGETPNVEAVIYDQIDLMISKYCPIKKEYKTKDGCGLCRKYDFYLEDRLHNKMRLIGLKDCGVRILNSKKLCLFEYKNELLASKLSLRLNFNTESSDEVKEILEAYKNDRNLNGPNYTFGRYIN